MSGMSLTWRDFQSSYYGEQSRFILLVEHERFNKTHDGSAVGKDADHIERLLILPLKRSRGFVLKTCG